MKAIDRSFPKIINGASQFIIPAFQRDYTWSEEHCKQIWQDVLMIAEDTGERGHFIGSVVYVSTSDSAAGFTRWLLIDGQQRITTLTLLLAALRDHIRQTGWQGSEDGPTAKRIEAYFLRNVQEEGDREIKLRLRRHDDATLQAIVNGSDLPEVHSRRIIENYKLFRELIQEADPEKIYLGVNRLVVVDVTLERGVDDPQLIFESLNSTGVDLSPADLIRNFILMRLDEREQTRLYEKYWGRIENLFSKNERIFNNFIRDYLALRTRPAKLERSDRVYVAFRREFADIGVDPQALEDLLADLLRSARHYASFAIRSANGELGDALADLRGLGDVPAIVIMRLYQTYEVSGTLGLDGFVEAVRLLESYLLRRAVLGAQSRGYGLEFAKLAYRIDDARPLDSLKVAIARMPASYAFPGDGEFEEALLGGDIYHKRICRPLLEALENRGSKEISDTSAYSVEHVLPQNEALSRAWREMLGPDWQTTQQTWLHRLGNLTLTGYNSRYSDRPFDEKKSMDGGFAQSSVRLNQDIRQVARWTAEEIDARGRRLARRALRIWPGLSVDKELIREAEIRDKRERARRRSVELVDMSPQAAELFTLLRNSLQFAFPELIEMAETKSVSYHDPEFFLETIPRKYGLGLLLALDFDEVEGNDGFAQDTSEYKFVMYASHQGGVLIVVYSAEEIDRAMPLVRRAHQLMTGI